MNTPLVPLCPIGRELKPRNEILRSKYLHLCYHRLLSFKLLKSPKVNTNSKLKSRTYLNMCYYFRTVDINKNSGLEIKYVINPGSKCTTINYPIFLEKRKLNTSMRFFPAINITKSYNGSQIRMLGHTTVTSYFDTDGKYEANSYLWVTQEGMSNLIVIDFCHFFFKALYFDIPALEVKEHTVLFSYGTLDNEKQYSQVSEIKAIALSQLLCIQARSTYLYKHQNTDLCYPKCTSFLAQKTVKRELVFINTVCSQREKILPILMESHKNHPITLNKGITGYVV